MLDKTKGIVDVTLDDVRNDLYEDIYEQTNGVVQAGPFKGMQIYPDRAWPTSNIAAELLGFFEQELHDCIEFAIERVGKLEKPVVVNVGCAEGYYAVGLARRLPNADVYAFDCDERSIQIAANNAKINKVKFADGQIFDALNRADLVFIDCEGDEIKYLDPDKYAGLANAIIIVELHPIRGEPHPVDVFAARFSVTHDAKTIVEGARDPNRSSLLWGRTSIERWLAVCEGRPCLMGWLMMVPR